MMKTRVVDMDMDCLDEVLSIEQACFRDPWPRSAFVNELQHPWSRFRVAGLPADADSLRVLQGFIICWQLPGDLHLLNLAVEPRYRRMGIGSLMLLGALDEFAAAGGGLVNLEVRQSNLAARKMYTAHGFAQVGCRQGYYRRQKEDAIVMTRKIAKAGSRRNRAGA